MSLIIKHDCGYEIDMRNGYVYSCPQCGGIVKITRRQRESLKPTLNDTPDTNNEISIKAGIILNLIVLLLIFGGSYYFLDAASKILFLMIITTVLTFLVSHWQFFTALIFTGIIAFIFYLKLIEIYYAIFYSNTEVLVAILKELRNRNNSNH